MAGSYTMSVSYFHPHGQPVHLMDCWRACPICKVCMFRPGTFGVLFKKPPPFKVDFLRKNPGVSLRYVFIENDVIESCDLLRCLILPRLEKLTLGPASHVVPLFQNAGDIEELKNMSYTVRDLDLGRAIPGQAALRAILLRCPHVEHLVCMVPGDPKEPSAFQRATLSKFSGAAVSETLNPARHSLTHIELEGSFQSWPTHDGSLLDLSSFSRLKCVQLPSYCLFTAKGPGRSRTGTYARLPPSLEFLKVWCNYVLAHTYGER